LDHRDLKVKVDLQVRKAKEVSRAKEAELVRRDPLVHVVCEDCPGKKVK
jgi:hypothetical protein